MATVSDRARKDISEMTSEELHELRDLISERFVELKDQAYERYDKNEYEFTLKVKAKAKIKIIPADYDMATVKEVIDYLKEDWYEYVWDCDDNEVTVTYKATTSKE